MRACVALAVAICLAACNQPAEPGGNAEAPAPIPTPAASPTRAAAVTVPKAFSIDRGPGDIQLMQCHMGECYWSQQRSATVVDRIGDGVRIKLVSRGGNSATGDGEVPEKWSPGIKVAWQDRTSYIRCSLTHPAMLSALDGEYLLDTLQLYVTPGFQVAAANEYMSACHGLAPGSWDEQTLKRLGYAEVDSGQSSYKTLVEGLKAMER